jgi:predicted dehydrogenase
MSRDRAALRVAIIGAGLMGDWHGRIARRLGADIRGVIDCNAERAQALARTLGAASTAKDASAFFQANDVNAVHICAPLATHQLLARESIQRGLHVLVEKPLTQTAKETDELYELALKNQVVLCPVHQATFQAGVERAARRLPGVGDVLAIDARIYSAGGEGRPEKALDEIVGEILPHPLSILRKLWPKARLEPECWSVNRSRLGEWLISGKHAGALFSMTISMHARPTCFEMSISGDRGSLQLDFFHGFSIRQDGRTSRSRKIARPFARSVKVLAAASTNLVGRAFRGESAYPGLMPLIKAFYDAARGEGPPPISAEDAIAVATARDAVLTSSSRLNAVI